MSQYKEVLMIKVVLRLLTPCLICFILLSNASALTISSDSPGNIFVSGQPIKLIAKDSQGEVAYEIFDYFNEKVAEGSGVEIKLEPLTPGWYSLKCKDDSEEKTVSFGVVINRGKTALPEDGRICTDVAAAWLVSPNKLKDVVRMMRLAGIPWARERFSWSGTEKERGKIEYNKYQTVADAYASEGVHLYEMWHDSPSWTHPGKKGNVCPDDLRDVYNFARTSASHFKNQAEAWEIWNEPDLGFWMELSDRFSGFTKAAYLGLKDGNTNLMVLQGALLYGATSFRNNLFECGTAGYFDIFNWHAYKNPAEYPATLRSHLELLKKYGADTRPIWLTEAGIHIQGTEGPDKRLLNKYDQIKQCQFMLRSATMSLVAGNDRNFFFVLLDYLEQPKQYGTLYPDLTPYPSFLALSAAANIIGESTYKGEYGTGTNDITAHVFSTPKGNVLVAWSDKETEMTVPTDKKTVRAANIFGSESSLTSSEGFVNVKVGPNGVYLLDIGEPVEKELSGSPRPRGKLPKLNPSRIVVVGHSNLPVSKNDDWYMIKNRRSVDYIVEVYNFNKKSYAQGTVELVVPDSWQVDNSIRQVSLDPMGRSELHYIVRPGTLCEGKFKFTMRADFGKEKVAPCVSTFVFDLAAIRPIKNKPLDWANDANRWLPIASKNCALIIKNSETGVLNVDTKYDGEDTAQWWAYPELHFRKPVDMSGYDGIAFDLNIIEDSWSSKVRLVLTEPNGAGYVEETKTLGKKHRVVMLFRDMKPFDDKQDDNGRLDLNVIPSIKFGCTTGREFLAFEASNFELVKFD